MRVRDTVLAFCVVVGGSVGLAAAPDGNRLTYLDGSDPYYVGRDFPKLTTPQWVGEEGVEAVVVLAIDDMRDPARYEAFLRPILDRLKAIDGRAALSIMACQVDPADPRLQGWIKEGLNIDVHTLDHPCPLLQKGDLAAAQQTYHGCVDLMGRIPGNRPVAFRMPCCDSKNTVSPRFFAEIFNKTSPDGHFLTIDTSVFHLFTPDDPALPRALVEDADGSEKFRKYVPFPSFVNTIENYPYPYVIGGLCWEFPCMVPSDWEAQNLHKPNSPTTVEDMKAALDASVVKQGVFNLVFHPHGWIKPEQVVELIDHAVKTHGKKVRFLNFREAQERLDRNLLGDRPLRGVDGQYNEVRLVDLNQDGYLDVTIGADTGREERIWDRSTRRWSVRAARGTVDMGRPRLAGLPDSVRAVDALGRDAGIRFVDLDEDGENDLVFSNDEAYGIYLFELDKKGWTRRVMAGKAGEPGALPKIVRDGKDNGFWVHSRSLWWQNEDTAGLPDLVDRRPFNELLKDVEPRAKTPEASRRSIRVRPGFTVETVAQEPLVLDPIAFDWGADGRLWVVEMGDYPLGADGKGKPGGVVRVLEDKDGDGRYDTSTVFLDGLSIPTGLIPWREGVIVACAPDIFYAEDRDGDGKADHREVLFTGFREGNPQHRANGFELGLDGWIYGANGDSGGVVRSVKTGESVDIRGRDFRFRPDDGRIEPESGATQYGRHRDDWGHWFGNNNPNWAWHYVLADRDLRRNPKFAPPDTRHMLESDTRVYPVSRTLARFNDLGMANRVTSANSATPYRDDLFGPHFAGNLFVSEPVHNLVHRLDLVPDGPTFRGVRAPGEADREFFASSDNWTRPTMLKTGPDGALWVADMYRAVIEHPEWIPDDWEAKLDLRAGHDRGRIYRVYPVDKKPRPIPRLDRLDIRGLVAALESPNGWQRDTAMRLLMHRKNVDSITPLSLLVIGTRRPETRVQALWTLSNLGELSEALERFANTAVYDPMPLLLSLVDGHPEVRRNALQAARKRLTKDPDLTPLLLPLVDDPDPGVRLQLALSLGDWDDPRAGRALAALVRRDPADPWLRAAVLSSATPHVGTLLAALFAGARETPPPPALVGPLVALAGSLKDGAAVKSLVGALATPEGKRGRFARWQFAALAGLLDARSPLIQADDKAFDDVWKAARALVADEEEGDDDREAAIRLLGREPSRRDDDRELLADLLHPRVSGRLQEVAVAAFARGEISRTPETLLEGWRGHSPRLRGAILDALLSRDAWTGALLSSLEDTCTPPAEIDPAHRRSLLDRRDPDLKRRAEIVFARETGSRGEALTKALDALKLPGDRAAGATVFKRACAACHRLGGEGTEVGPDLAALTDKSPRSLLTAIVDPNRAFESKYTNFTVNTADGRVLTGMIAAESSNAVTLRRQDGKEDVILRAEIEAMAGSGQSLMPEGLEKDLTPQDLADLIAFLGAAGPAAPKAGR